MNDNKQFISGHEIAVEACLDAGAEMMYGYPITPATEILTGWIKRGGKYLQTEDEIAAGFAVCGGVMAGQKVFTATSGPGNVLMQDGLSMAEGMRLPFVMIVAQRGGPSSGTVIYSQQEVILSCFGGNGEGMRFVYSPSTPAELYELIRRAFNDAWHYRFPSIVLTDGYTLKTKSVIDFSKFKNIENVPAYSLVPKDKIVHLANIYTLEEELNSEIDRSKKDFDEITEEIVLSENYKTDDAEILIVAHGIVAAAVKEAIDELRNNGQKVGLFRPITLRPFPKKELDKIAGWQTIKKIVVIESSLGQLARIVRDQLAPEISVPFEYMQYPALGVEAEEIVKNLRF